MCELIIKLIFGHLLGDYFLQPKEMAIRKSEKSIKGNFYCLLHCLVYTASVATTLQTLNPLILLIIFISHYPIDRYSLCSK